MKTTFLKDFNVVEQHIIPGPILRKFFYTDPDLICTNINQRHVVVFF